MRLAVCAVARPDFAAADMGAPAASRRVSRLGWERAASPRLAPHHSAFGSHLRPNVRQAGSGRTRRLAAGAPAASQPNRDGTPAPLAFTLIEVILAVAIASALLVVVLFFYRQAAELRGQVVLEIERTAAIRLVMDRLTSELRSVPATAPGTLPLYGDALTLEFVRTEVASRAAWAPAELGRVATPESDLRLVRYTGGDGLLTFGVSRSEEPLVGKRAVPTDASALPPIEATATNTPASLTEAIQFVRFRFWDGRTWLESWDATAPPVAVEISLGLDPLPENTLPEEYPSELFRRVVYLPAGSPVEEATDAPITAAPKEAGQ